MVQKRNNLELEIILLLLKENQYVRELAKKLGESHSTVLRKLNYLSKENVVDYKKEGKNNVFFLKENSISQSYVLKAELHKKIQIIKKYPELGILFENIIKETNEKLIILFGSFAKQLVKKTSDIDIYIETRDKKTKAAIERLNSRINVKIGPFNTQSPLIKEIIKNHVIIRGMEEFHEKIIST